MRDIGLVDFPEPVARLFTQGMVLKGGSAMSKSKGNVVDPTEMCAQYGADTVRLYVMFAAPPEKDFDWSDAGIEGASRFLGRVYRLVAKHADKLCDIKPFRSEAKGKLEPGPAGLSPEDRRLLRKAHQTLRHVTEDMEGRWHYNTDIAMAMELVNELTEMEGAFEAGRIQPAVFRHSIEYLVVVLSLFAPHLADELWEALGHGEPLLRTPWPAYDAESAAEEELEIPVQVNGKLRGRIRVAVGATEEEIRTRAQAEEKVAAHLNGRQIVKLIVVPQKLVNIVVK
jgi:leucyl-tRNA synthetase